jgi:hypothetical protein
VDPDLVSEGLFGDFILYPADEESEELSSRAVVAMEILAKIKTRKHHQYSHAAIVANTPDHQFEAKFPLTGLFPIDTSRRYEIWQVQDLTLDERRGITRWCLDHTRLPYDVLGLFTAGHLRLPYTYYCSRFACEAYESIGRHPGDLIKTPYSIPLYKGIKRVHVFVPQKNTSGVK